MRKITTAVLAAAMLLAMSISAGAHHRNPSLTFSANPTTVGGQVTATFYATQSNETDYKEAKLQACMLGTVHSAVAACDSEGATGLWTDVPNAVTSGPNHLPKQVTVDTNTAGVFGYRAWTADNNHTDPKDLTVNAQSGSGDRHNGCNGIENAVTKVKPGSVAAAKLAEIADRFNCDV